MEQVSRDYISKKIFYTDDNYEIFDKRREEFLDNLLDVNKSFAAPLSTGDLYVLRKRLGIGREKETIEQVALDLRKEPRIIESSEYEMLKRVRDYYSIKEKKSKWLMSSLDIHPDRENLYTMGLTYTDLDNKVRKAIKDARIGYVLRYSKIGLNRKGISYYTFDHVVDAVHNLQCKFIDELSPTERLYVIRRHKLDAVLASSSEWIVQYTRDLNRVFYPRTIKELAIASEFGFVNKDNLIKIFKNYGISVEYPYIYKGNDVDVVTKRDLLNFPLEGLGLSRKEYNDLSNCVDDLRIIDVVTRDIDVLDGLHHQTVEDIHSIVDNMGLEFVDEQIINQGVVR